jgi:hypothetical protein
MSTNNLSFKEFLETVEKPIDYFTGLKDEFGVSPEDATKGGQVASFLNMGNSTYNLTPYEVIEFLYDNDNKPTHARVKITNDPSLTSRKRWINKKGKNPVRMDDAEADEKIYTIPVADLQKMMTKGWTSMNQGMGMGGGLGM